MSDGEQLTRSLIAILTEPSLRARLAHTARSLVREHEGAVHATIALVRDSIWL